MTEDFITFELAKKLKEKGFKNNCIGYYDYAEEFHYNYESDIANKEIYFCHNGYDNIWHRDLVDAPTIAQVLKWLREEKKRHLLISTYHHTPFNVHDWGYDIINLKTYNVEHYDYGHNSYEASALAGIEYVIDNLI